MDPLFPLARDYSPPLFWVVISVVCGGAFKVQITDGSAGEESSRRPGDASSIPGLGRFSWRTKWQPIPVLLPENKQTNKQTHGHRSLSGYSRTRVSKEEPRGAFLFAQRQWFTGFCHFCACAWLSVRQFLKDGSLGFCGEQGADMSSLEKPGGKKKAAAPSRPP